MRLNWTGSCLDMWFCMQTNFHPSTDYHCLAARLDLHWNPNGFLLRIISHNSCKSHGIIRLSPQGNKCRTNVLFPRGLSASFECLQNPVNHSGDRSKNFWNHTNRWERQASTKIRFRMIKNVKFFLSFKIEDQIRLIMLICLAKWNGLQIDHCIECTQFMYFRVILHHAIYGFQTSGVINQNRWMHQLLHIGALRHFLLDCHPNWWIHWIFTN